MSGGGVSALILALIASICLAVLPQNLTNKYGNNAVGTLADGEPVVWKTIYINGTHEQNKAKLAAVTADDKYVKIVLQTDWACPEDVGVGSNGTEVVIWDMNGHTFYFSQPATMGFITNVLEFTDSSAAGTGLFKSARRDCGLLWFRGKTLILSGGTLQGYFSLYDDTNLIMTGGNLVNYGTQSVLATIILEGNNQLYFAPYITKSSISPWTTWGDPMMYNPQTSFEWRTPANANSIKYAVSKSDAYCGAHNYAYGVAWNLTAGDCLTANIKHDVPHYLWYRKNDDAWYQMLLAL